MVSAPFFAGFHFKFTGEHGDSVSAQILPCQGILDTIQSKMIIVIMKMLYKSGSKLVLVMHAIIDGH